MHAQYYTLQSLLHSSVSLAPVITYQEVQGVQGVPPFPLVPVGPPCLLVQEDPLHTILHKYAFGMRQSKVNALKNCNPMLVYYLTSEIGTTSLQGTKWLAP